MGPHFLWPFDVLSVLMGDIQINTSSFSLFAYSISVLSQAIIFVTLGSQANHREFNIKLFAIR